MLGAIRRVISGEDFNEEEQARENVAPVPLIRPNSQQTHGSNSTLSDDDDEVAPPAGGGGTPREEVPPSRVERMDSNDYSSESQERQSSQNSSRDWGWFEDVHQSLHENANPSPASLKRVTKKARGLVPKVSSGEVNFLPPENNVMAVTAPTYVLEESLSSQRLWKQTAGQRPPQPVEERAFYEKMWAQNFARSQVQYGMPVEVLTATSPISLSPYADGNFDSNEEVNTNVEEAVSANRRNEIVNQKIRSDDGEIIVKCRGDNVFGTTVSKSFANGTRIDTVNISIASYRVVESRHGKYAQFLVIYREGSISETVGVWKRYSDFERLAQKVTQAHEGCAIIANMSPLSVTQESETEHLPNAITSWRLLKKRQRWYRCLDAGYLSLKVFLLERFLHDILFESSSPKLLREFVGVEKI